MTTALSLPLTVTALALAAWALLGAARNRPPDLIQGIGLALVELLALVMAVAAALAWAGGRPPRETATAAAYLLTVVLLAPAGYAMARLESSRWGSVIVAVAALVIPVMVLRLHQVWG